jgi:hypothetical protein
VKREQFFREMKSGLLETVKTVYQPFVEEDIQILEKTTDRLFGIKWVFVCNEQDQLELLNEFFLEGQPVIVIWMKGNMKAISGICPTCSNLLTLSFLYSTCKCLNCGNHHNFQNETGELKVKEFPVKKKDDAYYIGFSK